jgi:hypothetical protein
MMTNLIKHSQPIQPTGSFAYWPTCAFASMINSIRETGGGLG